MQHFDKIQEKAVHCSLLLGGLDNTIMYKKQIELKFKRATVENP